MKKKMLGILIGSFCVAVLAAGCKKGELPTDYYFVAESESGDVLLSLDEDGNILSFLDEDGNSIDLTDAVVEKDENGAVVSVSLKDGSRVTVKEKASEEVVNKVIQNSTQKQAENTNSPSSEKTTEKASESKSEKASEQTSEKTNVGTKTTKEEFDPAKNIKPGVNAPIPNGEKKASVMSISKEERDLTNKIVAAMNQLPGETPANGTYYSNGDCISVYISPSEDSAKVTDDGYEAVLRQDNPVTLLGIMDNGWLHISYVSTGALTYKKTEPHTVEGYVPEGSLITEQDYIASMDYLKNRNIQIQKEIEEYMAKEIEKAEKAKKEKELKEKKEKEKKEKELKEKEEKEKKEQESEISSEEDSEKEKASEETSEKEETSEISSEEESSSEQPSEKEDAKDMEKPSESSSEEINSDLLPTETKTSEITSEMIQVEDASEVVPELSEE